MLRVGKVTKQSSWLGTRSYSLTSLAAWCAISRRVRLSRSLATSSSSTSVSHAQALSTKPPWLKSRLVSRPKHSRRSKYLPIRGTLSASSSRWLLAQVAVKPFNWVWCEAVGLEKKCQGRVKLSIERGQPTLWAWSPVRPPLEDAVAGIARTRLLQRLQTTTDPWWSPMHSYSKLTNSTGSTSIIITITTTTVWPRHTWIWLKSSAKSKWTEGVWALIVCQVLRSSKWPMLSATCTTRRLLVRSSRVYQSGRSLKSRLIRIKQLRLAKTMRLWRSAWCAWLSTKPVRSCARCHAFTSSIGSVLISGCLSVDLLALSANSTSRKTTMWPHPPKWAPTEDTGTDTNDTRDKIVWLAFTSELLTLFDL